MERNKLKAALAIVLASALALVYGCTISAGIKKKPTELDTTGEAPSRTPVYEHGAWTIARASLHNHTVYSDGCRSPEDLLELARMNGMAVLAITDHREGKICVDVPGKPCVKVGGVESVGYEPYYDHLRKIQQTARGEGMIVLKGVEVIPYFYNYGKGANFVLDGLQEHFTVYGIEDVKVFETMPTRGEIGFKPEPVPDEKPWQDFVDHIIKNGGIVHAVHVDEGADMWYGPAHGLCPPVEYNLYRIRGLTDFSILPSGWNDKAGGAGGWWDTTLIEYMAGLRDRPMWAMGDSDYHCEMSPAIATTLLYMRSFDEPEVYRCMREGRMVALEGDAFQDSYVAEWWAAGEAGPKDPVMLGREIRLHEAPVIKFSLDHPVAGCVTRLIRNGVVIEQKPGTELLYVDHDLGKRKEPAYYRVEVRGPRADRGDYDGPTMAESELFTNPIFVRFD